MTGKRWLLILLAVTGVWAIALMYARRPHIDRSSPEPVRSAAYADPSVCASCHNEIARTYSLTGMARGFSRVTPDVLAGLKSCATGTCASFVSPAPPGPAEPVAQDFSPAAARVFHKASNRYYTIVERDGRVFQRRHQIGFGGRETNALELEAHYVVGSGNHARTFLHRTADGRLLQLPVTWYGERQGYWAMSPGYDRPAHLDFRRVIDGGCMSCHNGFPRARVEDDREGLRFSAGRELPEGIDCQRCHGPGQAHVDAANARDIEAAVRAIVNPAKLDRERQLETCMQCHLESTSSPLPFQIRRYEHPPFSYVPGQPLGDYFIHFDHAADAKRDDKFEIASAAYRLRKSECFQRSEMTCVTCHDPHDVARGAEGVKRYVAICEGCHQTVHRSGVPKSPRVGARSTCLDCHMPKRRAEDAVHVVMTDHYIQRDRPSRDLLADRTEAHSAGAYRGEVVPYYPQKLPDTPANELYVAVAQVQDGSNLTDGIRQLQQAIERHRPRHAAFYWELARAYSMAGDPETVIRWCREALQREPTFVPALKELAAAAMTKGRYAEAAEALEKAVALRSTDANALADLGSAYLRQGRAEQARAMLERALAIDPGLPGAHNSLGLAFVGTSAAEAEIRFREAIRFQPDLAEAHNNLGNLLAGRRAYPEAAFHFAQAIASNPNDVEAHHSYGLVLALTGAHSRAAAELETAVRLAPDLLTARLDLADVLMKMGRRADARVHFEAAARSADPEVREAALAGLRAQ